MLAGGQRCRGVICRSGRVRFRLRPCLGRSGGVELGRGPRRLFLLYSHFDGQRLDRLGACGGFGGRLGLEALSILLRIDRRLFGDGARGRVGRRLRFVGYGAGGRAGRRLRFVSDGFDFRLFRALLRIGGSSICADRRLLPRNSGGFCVGGGGRRGGPDLRLLRLGLRLCGGRLGGGKGRLLRGSSWRGLGGGGGFAASVGFGLPFLRLRRDWRLTCSNGLRLARLCAQIALIGFSGRPHFCLGQQRMVKCNGGQIMRRDDDLLADPGHPPELGGECGGQPYATMRGRMPRHHAEMHRDSRPGDPLHERHRRAGINIGSMESFAADDAENAFGRRMSRDPCRDRRTDDEATVIVNRHMLIGDRGDEEQRSLELGSLGLGLARRRCAGLVGRRQGGFFSSNMALRSGDATALARRLYATRAFAAPKKEALRHGRRAPSAKRRDGACGQSHRRKKPGARTRWQAHIPLQTSFDRIRSKMSFLFNR